MDTHIELVKSIYNNNKDRIKLEGISLNFPIESTVRQGNVMSPKLFITILKSMIRKLEWKNTGFNINEKYLSHFKIAVDLVLFQSQARNDNDT